jgi:hypothetical protein
MSVIPSDPMRVRAAESGSVQVRFILAGENGNQKLVTIAGARPSPMGLEGH